MAYKNNKYKNPKRPSIYVTDPNDPRLQAYNDSLKLHINSQHAETYWNKALLSSYTADKDLYAKDLGITTTEPKSLIFSANNRIHDYNLNIDGSFRNSKIKPEFYHKYETGYDSPAEQNVIRLDDSGATNQYVANYKKPEQPVKLELTREQSSLKPLQTRTTGFSREIPEALEKTGQLGINPKYREVYSKHPADVKQYGSKGKFLHYAEQDNIGNWHPLKETPSDLNILEEKKYGGSMKYRKYGNMKSCKFGDFLEDYGKTMLNMAASPIEGIVGRDFYNPEFNGQAFTEYNNVASEVMKAGTDIAGSIALGPAYGAGKQALQTGVNALDPEGNLNQPKTMKYGGKLTSFKGNTHENGGIKMPDIGTEVEDGESMDNDSSYVYSDSIKFDKELAEEFGFKKAKNKTISQYAKRIDKLFSREDDVFDKKSKDKMLDRLTEAQESFKIENFSANFENNYKKKMGGHLYKMALGGFNGDPMKIMTAPEFLALYPNSTFDDYNAYYTSTVPELSNDTPNTFLEDSDLYNGTPVDFKGLPATGGARTPSNYKEMNVPDIRVRTTPQELGKYELPELTGSYKSTGENPAAGDAITENVNINPLYDVGRLAPMIANGLSGLKSQKLDNNKYRTKGRVTAPEFNIDPLLQDNRAAYSRGLDSIKGASGGNAGTYLSNISSINSAKGRLDSKAYTDKFNLDSQNKFRADQMNVGIEQGNNQMDFQVDDWNARSSEQAKNLQRKAASDLANLSQVKMEESLMQAYIDATSDNYDYNFTRYIPKSKKYKQTYGNG